jgi:hypothetical protein
MKMLRTFLKKVLPWLVAVGIFAYLFDKYPPAKVYNSLKIANIPYFCLMAGSYCLLMYFLDTLVMTKILKHFGHECSYKDTLCARGVTYLIMIINYAASQVAFALYQNRKHGMPMAEMFGIFGIIVVIDLLILATLAFITTFFTTWPFDVFGMSLVRFVRIFTFVAYAGLILSICFWRGYLGKIGFLEKFRSKDFFSVLQRAGFKDYIAVGLLRLPVHVFIMCGMYLAVQPFNVHIPLVKILSNIPIIFFIGALPISPGGLGTSNAALVELLKPFLTGPAITSGIATAGEMLFSFSLAWMFANYIMKGAIGAVSLKFASRDLFKAALKEGDRAGGVSDVTHLAEDL